MIVSCAAVHASLCGGVVKTTILNNVIQCSTHKGSLCNHYGTQWWIKSIMHITNMTYQCQNNQKYTTKWNLVEISANTAIGVGTIMWISSSVVELKIFFCDVKEKLSAHLRQEVFIRELSSKYKESYINCAQKWCAFYMMQIEWCVESLLSKLHMAICTAAMLIGVGS